MTAIPTQSESSASPLNILIVDDELNIRKVLALSLEKDGHRVVTAGNLDDALAENGRQSFDLAFVDLRLGTGSGLDLIPKLLGQSPWLQIVVITAFASYDTAVQAIKAGATDYLPKPFTPVQVRLAAERAAKVRALEQQAASSATSESAVVYLDSASPAMRRAVEMARQVADSDATILIRGESGTGKGVLARAIHQWSRRAARPFSVVSCPAISPQLLESELFGHAKGAFTGAIRDNPGRIAASAGGTLFLDEIGDLPAELQPKLLRFVQDREYERVGDATPRRADVRLITATNIDLERAVAERRFREDLLYRINVISIELPPLRERQEDIAPLAAMFLSAVGRPGVRGFTPEAEALLKGYTWPGNLRELRNAVERAAILCRSDTIAAEHLPGGIGVTRHSAEASVGDRVTIEQLEEAHIRRILSTTHSLDEAAQVLGIDAATLYRKRKRYAM